MIVDRARELVAQHVGQHRAELLELVDQELDRQLAELVDQRLATRNGAGKEALELRNSPTRLCADCGQRPTLKQRTICQTCKTRRARARETGHARAQESPSDDEQPHPDPGPAVTESRSHAAASTNGSGAIDISLAGIDVAELARRANAGTNVGKLRPAELQRWLLSARLADIDARGVVHLTERGLALGGGVFT